MNRTEWEASNDPLLLLDWLRERGSNRKFRLFACGCARRIGHIFIAHDIELLPALESAEEMADGQVRQYVPPRRGLWTIGDLERERLRFIVETLNDRHNWARARIVAETIRDLLRDRATILAPGSSLADLVRDLFSHLFHANPLWMSALTRTDEVERLARTIYEERSFSEVPVLGDALEDAGCVDAEVLEHCRDGGEHARGCWVVDAILGRS